MAIEDELKSFAFKTAAWKFRRCLAPGMECNAKAIRAHSVQNARVLDLLSRDGHVTGLTKRIDREKGPQIAFNDIGRNQATTFTGLCSSHDAEIFRSLDTAPFDPTNPQHLFLTAYRSLIRELHAVMEAVVRLQAGYEKRVTLGLDPEERPSPAGMVAVEYMMKSYLAHLYKNTFDKALVSGNYTDCKHDVIWFRDQRPTIAVSSHFGLGSHPSGNDWLRTALNVVPMSETETIAIFSYRSSDALHVRTRLKKVLDAKGDYQKYELSKLILSSCENFVLAPNYVDQWGGDKRNAVTKFYIQTMFEDDVDKDSEHFYLF